MRIFRGRGVFINVYKAGDKIATSGAASLADIDLRRTYRAIDSVATGRIPSLFCAASQGKPTSIWCFTRQSAHMKISDKLLLKETMKKPQLLPGIEPHPLG